MAVQADIKKAFFMIGIREEDRPYLRFIWPDDAGVMRAWRLSRVPFGVNCSPFLLTAVIQHHLKLLADVAEPETEAMLRVLSGGFYVDDCIVSLPDAAAAERFHTISMEAMSQAGMELRKWRSNAALPFVEEPDGKVLGVHWLSARDVISFPVSSCDQSHCTWTKRVLLQCIAVLFDPLGLISPYVLQGKLILQELWKLGVAWDDVLASRLSSIIEQWWGDRHKLSDLHFPRWLGGGDGGKVSVHMFCDASERAFGCCIYFVWSSASQLVFAKSKVAPLKSQSLARLELQAALLGARCLQMVLGETHLEAGEVHAWSDSLTVCHWLAKEPYHWKTYVANRVAEIQEISQSHSLFWHHCPGCDNPADIVSRGCDVATLECSVWCSGPSWLCSKSLWPPEVPATKTDEVQQEVSVRLVLAVTATDTWWERCSNWSKVMRVAQRILSWRYRGISSSKLHERAESALCYAIQSDSFPQEMSDLLSGSQVSRSSKLFPFQPFVDQHGLIRATGRLQFSDLEDETKHPVILAPHYLTELMLRYVHEKRLHQGVEGCLAFIRRRFHVLSGRRLLRRVKESCVTCRRYDAQPASEIPAPLPADRATYQRAFSVIGVDHAGPMVVREAGKSCKSWILLFVCASTQAVHLELVMSLSADEFLLAFRRFIAHYGKPMLIRSDNGTSFVAAFRQVNVEWRFNPPASPWHGGFYERLVAPVKSPLRRVLGRAQITASEMRTILSEVEQVVNDRPLTHVGSWEEQLPLTPNMLVGRGFGAPWKEEELIFREEATRRIRYLAQLHDRLVVRWNEEYLVSLRNFHRAGSHHLQVGDVDLLMDDQRKRVEWKMAAITELFPGRDGLKRVAQVRVGQRLFLRPIQRLVPMELHEWFPSTRCAPVETVSEEASNSTEKPSRPVQREPEVVTQSGRVSKRPERL